MRKRERPGCRTCSGSAVFPNNLPPEGFALPVLAADEADDAVNWLLTTAGQALPEGLAGRPRR